MSSPRVSSLPLYCPARQGPGCGEATASCSPAGQDLLATRSESINNPRTRTIALDRQAFADMPLA
jgi:hypothetical protein